MDKTYKHLSEGKTAKISLKTVKGALVEEWVATFPIDTTLNHARQVQKLYPKSTLHIKIIK
jgi:hypothetical protein